MHPDHISISDLQTALRKVAKMVKHDQVYMPIFERLEREIAAAEHQSSVMARVMALAA